MKNTFFLLILLLFPFAALAQDEQESMPETLPDLLQSLEDELAKSKHPGLMLTIVTADSVLFQGGIGMAEVASSTPVTAEHRFRLGSVTKSFAALAIFHLEAEGKLSLDAPLHEIAPELPFQNPWQDTHPVTVRHLLSHTAGFDDMPLHTIYHQESQEPAVKDMLNMHASSLVSRWQPGTRFAYANPGYLVVTYLIEKFSGKSYHAYVQEKIFDPIGMKNANLQSFVDEPSRHAKGYYLSGNGPEEEPFSPIIGAMAGTLNASAADMARFVQFMLNKGMFDAVQLLPAHYFDLMEKPQATLAANAGVVTGYGLGNYSSGHDKCSLFHGHNGGIKGFLSSYAYNRDLNKGFALSGNMTEDIGELSNIIMNFLCRDASSQPIPAPTVLPQDIEIYEGYYQLGSPRNQIFYIFDLLSEGFSLYRKGDSLFTKGFFKDPSPLLRVEGMHFRREAQFLPTVVFLENQEGKPSIYLDNNYFFQSSAIAVWGQRLLFFGGFLLALGVLVAGVVWVFLVLTKSIGAMSFKVRFLPFLSALSLWIMLAFFLAGADDLSVFSPNLLSIGIYIASLLFPLCAAIGLLMLSRSNNQHHWALTLFLLLANTWFLALSAWLWLYDWIGIRFWAY